MGHLAWRVLAWLMLASPWRLQRITNPDRIGHLVGELDCLLKERALGRLPARWPILLLPASRTANEHLLGYLSSHLRIVRPGRLHHVLERLYAFRALRYREDTSPYVAAINATAELAEIARLWGERPPLLALRASDRARGKQALASLGVPPEARYVCFHVREGGYSPRDEHLHSFRNAEASSYAFAMRTLVARGFWCIRLGDPTMKPLPPMEGVIDYAHSDLRADWLDVFLCASATFFVGNTSGLFLVASAFGVPCCLTNIAPFSAAPAYGGVRDLGIPKLIFSARERRLLRFEEILGSPIGNFRHTDMYEKEGLRPLESEPEDIEAVVREMLDQHEGQLQRDPRDEERQARFQKLMRPGHHAYGGASRVGRDFLRKYEHLLE